MTVLARRIFICCSEARSPFPCDPKFSRLGARLCNQDTLCDKAIAAPFLQQAWLIAKPSIV